MWEQKNSELRRRIASQIFTGRNYDTHTGYERQRRIRDYVYELEGIKHLFEFIRLNKNQLKSNLILDMGTGNGKAISQIKQSSWTTDLKIEATTLSNKEDTWNNFPEGLHITTAETLRGIESLSVAAVLSVYGLSYSQSPEMTAASLNRVIVPSGIVKATFYSTENDYLHRMRPNKPDKFVEELKKLGWKTKTITNHHHEKLMLAIKPPCLIEPDILLDLDKDQSSQQFSEVYDI